MSRPNKSKKNKKVRRSRGKTRRFRGGQCPSCSGSIPLQNGGYGQPSLQPIPIRYFSPVNTYSSDPSTMGLVEGRNYSGLKGGRRKRMKGGDLLLGNNKDIYTTFGNTEGAFSGAALLSGNGTIDPNNSNRITTKYV